MKIRTLLASALAAFLSLAATNAAHATVVDFSGSNVNMGTVDYGQSGTITDIYAALFSLPPNVVGQGEAYGFLPANSKITFTYTLTGLHQGSLQSYGSYSYIDGGLLYDGSTLSDTAGPVNVDVGTIDGSPSLPLVLSTANLTVVDPGTSTGTTTITNNSNSFAQFQTMFLGILQGLPPGVGIIHYNVSAIPLPAALPMFGALLASMFGFARFRRKNAAA